MALKGTAAKSNVAHGREEPQPGKRARLVVDSVSPASCSSDYTDSSSSSSTGSQHHRSSRKQQQQQQPQQRSTRRSQRQTLGMGLGRRGASRGSRHIRILTPKSNNHFSMTPQRRGRMLFPQFGGANTSRSTRASNNHNNNNKFHVRVDSNEQLSSSSNGHSKASARPPPARVLRKRKRADVTPGSSDSEDDPNDGAQGYRKPRNVIDLTSTDDDDDGHEDYGTADEGSSQHQSSEVEHDSDQEQNPDAEFYMHHATTSQLAKLRKPTLVQLLTQLKIDYPSSFDAHSSRHFSGDDTEHLPKHTLLTSLLQAREVHAAMSSSSPPPSSASSTSSSGAHSFSVLVSPSKANLKASGMSRSTSLPTLPDATPGTARKRRNRLATGSISLAAIPSSPSVRRADEDEEEEEDDDEGFHVLRNGKVVQAHQKPDALPESPTGSMTRLTRSTSRLASLVADCVDDEEDEDEDGEDEGTPAPTPVAHRTRTSARLSGDGRKSRDSSGKPVATRTLRNGKVVGVDAEEEADESAEEDEEAVHDEDEDAAELSQDEERVDVRTASANTLLRLRRDDLVQLCQERDLEAEGTKKDMVNQLIVWRRQNPVSSTLSGMPDSSSSGDETEHEGAAPKTIVGKAARRETKTQALAQVDTFVPDKPGIPPLLLDPKRPRRQSRPETIVIDGGDEEEEEQEAEADKTREEDEASVALDLESLKLQDKAISADSLVKAEKIGSGGFKDVYKGTYRKIKVAICDIRGHLSDNEIKELGLMRDLRHENVVRLVGVVAYSQSSDVPCSLVTELCLNGDLFDYIRRDAPVPSFDKMLKIMSDIAAGLDYLHSRTPKIIHRDMKSSNVLITARGVAKITDFGLARVKNTTRSLIRSLVGTVNWQAPELWVPHPRYNEKVDCYAAGLVFWECLQWYQPVKKYPFEGMNEHAIYQEVGQKQLRPSTAGMRRHWGGEILDLVDRLWSQKTSERPSMKQTLEELTAMRAQHKAASRR